LLGLALNLNRPGITGAKINFTKSFISLIMKFVYDRIEFLKVGKQKDKKIMLASKIMIDRGWTQEQVYNACNRGMRDSHNPYFLAAITLSGTSEFWTRVFKDAEKVIKEAFYQGTAFPR
jgi:hypothetical protein